MDEDPSKRLRMSAIQALKHPFITDIAVRLIDELNDTSSKEGRYLNKIAKGSLEQLKIYRPYMTWKDE
tara:strand:+ start:1094 stop:1297 length:204 start_codon:yes stop_codon:yes gene_type:complete